MHVTNKDEMKCENVKWKKWWYKEDGVVEHSKVQELESRKICQKFWAWRDLKGIGEWQLQMSG